MSEDQMLRTGCKDCDGVLTIIGTCGEGLIYPIRLEVERFSHERMARIDQEIKKDREETEKEIARMNKITKDYQNCVKDPKRECPYPVKYEWQKFTLEIRRKSKELAALAKPGERAALIAKNKKGISEYIRCIQAGEDGCVYPLPRPWDRPSK